MKKIFFPIFVFCCLIFCKNSFAMEHADVAAELAQRPNELEISGIYSPEPKTEKPEHKFVQENKDAKNLDELFERFQVKVEKLANQIVPGLQQSGSNVVGFETGVFIYLLKQIFDKNFLEFLIQERYLNLSTWKIDGVECAGLRWLMQESFGENDWYSPDFETNFIIRILIPRFVKFFNEWFIVEKLNLANNNLPEITSGIINFKSLEYLQIQGNLLNSVPFFVFDFSHLKSLFFSVDTKYLDRLAVPLFVREIMIKKVVIRQFD